MPPQQMPPQQMPPPPRPPPRPHPHPPRVASARAASTRAVAASDVGVSDGIGDDDGVGASVVGVSVGIGGDDGVGASGVGASDGIGGDDGVGASDVGTSDGIGGDDGVGASDVGASDGGGGDDRAPASPQPPPAAAAGRRERSPRQRSLRQMGGVTDGDDLTALSNTFGVSSTLYLGAPDVLKLRAALDEHAEAPATLRRVLARLKLVPLTRDLRDSTRIDESVSALTTHADGEVSGLAARIVEAWAMQLAREPRKSAAPRALPKPKCKACAGQKRSHTCGEKGKAVRARMTED